MSRFVFIYIVLIIFIYKDLVYAQGLGSQTTTVSVNASVADTLDFAWDMYKLRGDADPWSGVPHQTVMDFGEVAEIDHINYPGRKFSEFWYCIFLWIAADMPYHIKQTSQSLMTSDGQYNLDNSFVVTPDYNANDRWAGIWPQGPIGNDQLGPPSLVKNADIIYYGNDGRGHIVRIYYAIPATSVVTGWQPIPRSWPQGQYQGSITISITSQSP